MIINKICITGPESTGKTTLVDELSGIFNAVSVPEYAREYLKKLNIPYNIEDLKKIATGQLDLKNSIVKEFIDSKDDSESGVVFFDTDLITISIWMSDKFGTSDKILEQNILENVADYYLILYPDLKWEYDPLREDKDRLKEIFEMYVSYLNKLNVSYSIIRGQGEQRTKSAVQAINSHLGI